MDCLASNEFESDAPKVVRVFIRGAIYGMLFLGSVLATSCADHGSILVDPPQLPTSSAIMEETADTLRFLPSYPSRPVEGWQDIETPSAEERIHALTAVHGRAIIGLKRGDAEKATLTGVYPAITRADAVLAVAELEARGVQILRTFRNVPSVIAIVPPHLANDIAELPFVHHLRADREIDPRGGGSSEELSDSHRELRVLTSQDTAWAIHKIRAPRVWNNHLDFSGAANRGQFARVTVIDSGIDSTHVLSSSGDIDGFTTSELLFVQDTSSFPIFQITHPWDRLYHGTHVIGDVGAWDNGIGYIGGAPSVEVTSIRICDDGGACWESAMLEALDYTVDNGSPRQIVNVSQTVANSTELSNLADENWNAGNLLVGAAGNSGSSSSGIIAYPAKLSRFIAVTGTLQDDSFAENHQCPRDGSFVSSNHGSEAELSAPFETTAMELNGAYGTDCGTSMSSALVSATAALVWSKFSDWTNNAVRTRLVNTAVDLGTSGRDPNFGYGRVDAGRALAFEVEISGPLSAPEGTFCSWSSSIDGGQSPYSYEWRQDSQVVSTSAGVTLQVPSEDFVLSITVQDAHGEQADDAVGITVTANTGEIQC